jgi:hypothetical protein
MVIFLHMKTPQRQAVLELDGEKEVVTIIEKRD